ncbi:MAG: L,D-transpeptidase [Acidimicrobiia bacterium]
MPRWVRFVVLVLVAVAACTTEEKGFTVLATTGTSIPSVATTTSSQPMTTTTAGLAPVYEGQIAHASADVFVYSAPNSPFESRVIPALTILGSPAVFPVLEGPVEGWIKVSIPGRPNEATGWVEADQFTFAKVDQRIEIDLAASTLTFFVGEEAVITTPVSIGSPENPTPPGTFFVTDIVELTDPTGPWGPHALGLSARSDTITEFNGGDGIIGIHGTNRPDRIGDPVSLGCVRVPNEIITEIARQVQLGIPVVIK